MLVHTEHNGDGALYRDPAKTTYHEFCVVGQNHPTNQWPTHGTIGVDTKEKPVSVDFSMGNW